MRVNGSFTISCFIDTAKGELNFFDGEDMLPNDNIQVGIKITLGVLNFTYLSSSHQKCNDTINCIKFTSFFTKATKKNFTCKKDRRSAVGDSMVRVADTIDPVKNFKCRTNNLTTVFCSFKQPNSSVIIKYKLKFSMNNQTKVRK